MLERRMFMLLAQALWPECLRWPATSYLLVAQHRLKVELLKPHHNHAGNQLDGVLALLGFLHTGSAGNHVVGIVPNLAHLPVQLHRDIGQLLLRVNLAIVHQLDTALAVQAQVGAYPLLTHGNTKLRVRITRVGLRFLYADQVRVIAPFDNESTPLVRQS